MAMFASLICLGFRRLLNFARFRANFFCARNRDRYEDLESFFRYVFDSSQLMCSRVDMKTKEQIDLLAKIKRAGQINSRKLTNNELLTAIDLARLGLIKHKVTKRGNVSRFLVLTQNN